MGIFGNKEEIEKVYGYDIMCENCNEESYFDIPFGTTIKYFLKDKKCEICGCFLNGGDEE